MAHLFVNFPNKALQVLCS